MTIIVAFILEAFVFRMNYSRKNQDSEGWCRCLPLVFLSSCQLFSCLDVQSSGSSAYQSGLSFLTSYLHYFQILNDQKKAQDLILKTRTIQVRDQDPSSPVSHLSHLPDCSPLSSSF